MSELDGVVQGYLKGVGWMPSRIELVAGAVHDRELNAVERLVLHRIVDAHGVTRHPSGNTELTNWSRLDDALADFAAGVQPAGVP